MHVCTYVCLCVLYVRPGNIGLVLYIHHNNKSGIGRVLLPVLELSFCLCMNSFGFLNNEMIDFLAGILPELQRQLCGKTHGTIYGMHYVTKWMRKNGSPVWRDLLDVNVHSCGNKQIRLEADEKI